MDDELITHEQYKDYRIVVAGETVAFVYSPGDDPGKKLSHAIYWCQLNAKVYQAPAAVKTLRGNVIAWHTEGYDEQLELF